MRASICLAHVLTCLIVANCLCSCTSTTTIKPYNPALQGNVETIGADGAAKYADESRSEEGGLAKKSTDELISTGFSYLAAGNTDLARLYFMAAIKRNPQLDWPFVGLGNIEYHAGNYQAALLNFQKASSLEPKNLSAVLGQAQVLRQQGNLDAAGERLSQALKLAPNDIRVLTELAIVYDIQGQGNLATPLFQEVVAKMPNESSAYNNLGVNYLYKGEYREAIAAFNKAQMISPSDSQVTNNLAVALALAGEEAEALSLFSKTLGVSAAWNNIGYLYMMQKRYDDAERALHKAIELNPEYYVKARENLDRLNRIRANQATAATGK